MSFNVSRFLVRVRQFWTRERLVPVLGIAALFLFLLNFLTYLNSLLDKRPIIALHTMGDPGALSFDVDGEHRVFIFRDRDRTVNGWHHHDHATDNECWKRHFRERMRDRMEAERDLGVQLRGGRWGGDSGRGAAVDEEEVRIEVNGKTYTVHGKRSCMI